MVDQAPAGVLVALAAGDHKRTNVDARVARFFANGRHRYTSLEGEMETEERPRPALPGP
jgi:hypothetical protein